LDQQYFEYFEDFILELNQAVDLSIRYSLDMDYHLEDVVFIALVQIKMMFKSDLFLHYDLNLRSIDCCLHLFSR